MKNEEILNNWYDSIKEYPKLSFKEAKELSEKINNTNFANQKIELRQSLILGTLHVVYVYLKNQNLDLYQSKSYDMNDIINSAIETWINIIDSNGLLNQENYFGLFNNGFDQMIVNRLGISNNEINEKLSIDDKVVKKMEYTVTDTIEDKVFIESILLDTDLNPLERFIINKLFGLNNEDQETYETLSEKLKLKKEEIKHTEKDALIKLRNTIIGLQLHNNNSKTL